MALTFHQVVVFVSGYIVYGLSIGFLYGFGAIFPVIMDTFNATRAEASIIPSVYGAFLLGGGIVYGIITSKIGAMKTTMVGSLITSASLILSFWTTSLPYLIATSVCTACGLGMCFVACTVGVRAFFAGKSSVVALALMSSSSGTTGVVLTYILQYLSDWYGLRGTLLIIGGLELHGAVLCLLWKPQVRNESQSKNEPHVKKEESSIHILNLEENKITNSDIPNHIQNAPNSTSTQTFSICMANEIRDHPNDFVNEGYTSENGSNVESIHETTTGRSMDYSFANRDLSQEMTYKSSIKNKLRLLLRSYSFIFTVIATVFCINSLNQYVAFLVDMYLDRGYSRPQGSAGLTIMNIAAIFGRAAPAAIAKCKFYNTFLLPVSSTFLASLSMFLLTLVKSIAMFNILSGFIGFGLGVCVSVLVVSVSELVEPECLAEGVGLLMSINGVFALFGGPITGYLRDSSGSYTVSQILTFVFTGLGSILFVVAACFHRKRVIKIQEKKRTSLYYVTKL